MTELARVGTYAAAFALALGARRYWRELLGGTVTAIVAICAIALLSRFEPGLFAEAPVGEFFGQEVVSRLAYPLNYSSGLGALAAIGLPVLLGIDRRRQTRRGPSRWRRRRFPSARSRSGSPPRASRSQPRSIGPDGVSRPRARPAAEAWHRSSSRERAALILFAAEVQRDALDLGLTDAIAERQGDEMLVITLVVCAGVGLTQVAISLLARHAERPAGCQPTRSQSLAVTGVATVAALAVAVAAGAPGEASDAWDRFTSQPDETPVHETRAGQILEFSSNGRYDFWQVALDAGADEPLTGIGPGTFEFWWTEHGSFGLRARRPLALLRDASRSSASSACC